MTFEFKPAKRENVSLLIGLASASGGGKTKSALELATGLSPSGKIMFLDTEARRALHYASEYKFMHADMRPPFHPDRFIEGIQAAEAAGAEVVIIDSASHEYDGEGGILDWAAEIEAGTPKAGIEHPRAPNDGDGWKDWEVKPVKSPGNWKEPKLAHKKMMNALLQCRAHIIFCLRADEKIRIIPPSAENKYRTQIEPLGWTPICEKRFMFEMTLSLTLRPDAPGRPDYNLPHKIQDQHRPMFPAGKFITRAAGEALAKWARGEDAAAPKADDNGDAFNAYSKELAQRVADAKDAAELGSWWNSDAEKTRRMSLNLTDNESAQFRNSVMARINELKTATLGSFTGSSCVGRASKWSRCRCGRIWRLDASLRRSRTASASRRSPSASSGAKQKPRQDRPRLAQTVQPSATHNARSIKHGP